MSTPVIKNGKIIDHTTGKPYATVAQWAADGTNRAHAEAVERTNAKTASQPPQYKTSGEMLDGIKAKEQAAAEAKAVARAREAAEPKPPVNAAEVALRQALVAGLKVSKSARATMKAEAKRIDNEREAAEVEAARVERLAADPGYIKAVEMARQTVEQVPVELREQATSDLHFIEALDSPDDLGAFYERTRATLRAAVESSNAKAEALLGPSRQATNQFAEAAAHAQSIGESLAAVEQQLPAAE